MIYSPNTYNIATSSSNPLAEEIGSAGISILHPIIVVNYIAFIAFWCLIFTNFRKTMYPEQDILVILFIGTLLLTFVFGSLFSHTAGSAIGESIYEYLYWEFSRFGITI